MSSLNKWECFKFKVREIAIRIHMDIAKMQRIKQEVIITDINKLCHTTTSSTENQIFINNLQLQLDNIYQEKQK